MKTLSIQQTLLMVWVTIFVTGCYTTNNTALIERQAAERPAQVSVDQMRTHSYNHPKEAVFDAIVAGIFEGGGAVETLDRSSGVISTGWNSGGGALLIALVGNYRNRHSFLVRPDGDSACTVIYTLHIEVGNGSQWMSFTPSRRNYAHITDYWAKLGERLEQNATITRK
jgi:hypothetical protein